MTPARGYYSIVQYCPDPARFEAANVGVVLLCPDRGFVDMRYAKDNARVTRFFERGVYDISRLNLYKKGLAERIREGGEIESRESFATFASLQVNLLRLTPPAFCRVEEPCKAVLERLFQDLVGETTAAVKQTGLKSRLRDAFRASGLLDTVVREEVHVRVPAFRREEEFPFAWTNGKTNLIEPVRFMAERHDAIESAAAKRAVAGQSLRHADDSDLGPCELNVVGQFRATDAEAKATVKAILAEAGVPLIDAASLPQYLQTIRNTGRPLVEVAV